MFISPFSPPQFSVTAQPPRPPLATTILDPGSSSSPMILPSSVDKVVPGGTGIIMSRPRIPRCFRPLSSMLHNEVREQLECGQLNYTIGIEKADLQCGYTSKVNDRNIIPLGISPGFSMTLPLPLPP